MIEKFRASWIQELSFISSFCSAVVLLWLHVEARWTSSVFPFLIYLEPDSPTRKFQSFDLLMVSRNTQQKQPCFVPGVPASTWQPVFSALFTQACIACTSLCLTSLSKGMSHFLWQQGIQVCCCCLGIETVLKTMWLQVQVAFSLSVETSSEKYTWPMLLPWDPVPNKKTRDC